MQVSLNFVTPLWTADASKQARRVVATGLIGSLRWWYEVMIRGLGGWACDPTDDRHRCQLDTNGFKSGLERGCEHLGKGKLCPTCEVQVLSENGLCVSCQVFGATGWAKTVMLALEDKTQPEYPPTGRIRAQTTDGRLNRENAPSAWYFPEGNGGEVALTLLPRHPNDAATETLCVGLLEFCRRNAVLGAKTALGYGFFDWDTPPESLLRASDFVQEMACRAPIGRVGPTARWPDLREMFFAEIDLRQPWLNSEFVNFKYDVRQAFRGRGVTPELRHFLLGDVKSDPRQASKIKMALWPNKSALRMWGWIPAHLPEAGGKITRAAVIAFLRAEILKIGSIRRWREFDSPQDTYKRYTDPQAYLKSLMEV